MLYKTLNQPKLLLTAETDSYYSSSMIFLARMKGEGKAAETIRTGCKSVAVFASSSSWLFLKLAPSSLQPGALELADKSSCFKSPLATKKYIKFHTFWGGHTNLKKISQYVLTIKVNWEI